LFAISRFLDYEIWFVHKFTARVPAILPHHPGATFQKFGSTFYAETSAVANKIMTAYGHSRNGLSCGGGKSERRGNHVCQVPFQMHMIFYLPCCARLSSCAASTRAMNPEAVHRYA
jgi:hypothetical protein